MAILIDTNVLMRLANGTDVLYPAAKRAILKLHRRGESLHLTAQNLVEFRNAATRPKVANGLGMTIQNAAAKSAGYEAAFPLLPETPDIFPAWKVLVAAFAVIGKRVHDARLMAVCQVHNVKQLLTFNVAHFAAMATFGAGIVIIDPVTV